MTHMNYKEQARSMPYDGPNPIRMSERSWRLMMAPLTPEQRSELTQLWEQARYTSRIAISSVSPSGDASSGALENAETAMTMLLDKLSELNVRHPVEGLVLVGSAV
ncbi:hypothetical protein [Acetobacter conturbans]|uniref:Uncharacterized protein n=1 Tax=Acetobacter conturbans TaxID=1737472 RepID=A0ABX0JZG1_9PROT|nr:hypothetical protein [Acetobacter conturbans]NHN88425.1 hypothetical protein [Acetobacter conturbans]